MDVIVTSSSDLQRIIDASIEAATAKVVARLPPVASVPKSWLSNREAMDFLGLSKSTLQRFRTSGRLPFAKIGASVYYRRADIEALLEDNLTEIA